jgi:hypothetical protein
MAFVRASCLAALVAVLVAGCSGTSRVRDELTTNSLSEARNAVALIKLGAADPLCTTLAAGIGVREGQNFRLVQTARIVRKADETAVAELELGTGEYHVVSYSCTRPRGGMVLLAHPAGQGLYKTSYASFQIAPGEILNVGYLQLLPVGSMQLSAFTLLLPVRIAVTDWPLGELDRFKQQRPKLYAQMKTRLMKVHNVEPPTVEQIQARCADMKRLQSEGKLQNLPTICTIPHESLRKRPSPAKKGLGV